MKGGREIVRNIGGKYEGEMKGGRECGRDE